MSHDVTNFLPPERARAFTRGYMLRLATVGIWLLIGVLLAHGVLLAPAYLYVSDTHAQLTSEMQSLSLAMEESANENVTARLQAIETTGATLLSAVMSPSASTVLAEILEVPHTSISLTGISVDVAEPNGSSHRVRVSGVADTREALRGYYLALTQTPSIAGVDLPLSAYAKDTDIAFSMDIQISLP